MYVYYILSFHLCTFSAGLGMARNRDGLSCNKLNGSPIKSSFTMNRETLFPNILLFNTILSFLVKDKVFFHSTPKSPSECFSMSLIGQMKVMWVFWLYRIFLSVLIQSPAILDSTSIT